MIRVKLNNNMRLRRILFACLACAALLDREYRWPQACQANTISAVAYTNNRQVGILVIRIP
jgi:hypothetical protein